MKRALIVGIDSFTGKVLHKHLMESGYDVYGTSIQSADSDKIRIVDLTDLQKLKHCLEYTQPDYVIHLAGVTHAQSSPLDTYNINVLGTENLLSCLKHYTKPLEKVVIASSASVYGNQEGALSENAIPDPVNHYGISKYAVEQISKGYFEVLPIVITRAFNYTGVGQSERFIIPKLAHAFKRKEQIISLGNVDTLREFNNVVDVAEIYKRIVESDLKSHVINIGSGRSHSIRQILEKLIMLSGHQIEVIKNEEFIRKNEIKELKCDPQKLKDLIGDDLFPTTLEETLKSFLVK